MQMSGTSPYSAKSRIQSKSHFGCYVTSNDVMNLENLGVNLDENDAFKLLNLLWFSLEF